MSAAQALIHTLKSEGVEVIFGLPGGAILPIYDALYDSDLKHILVRHESGAAFMADGYAKATGRVGVCMATSGPGATNLITGIASAYMDSVPMVIITGQVPRSLIGLDAFQEADIRGITMPITKHNYLVMDPEKLPEILKQAFHIARTGRPGPVLIDIPRDVQMSQIDYKLPQKILLRGYNPVIQGHPLQIKKAAQLILESERPVILAGGGAIWSGAAPEIYKLATLIMAPVATTLMGKGVFPETHPLSLGMAGMHGTRYANNALSEADLIIAIGCRFDDRLTGKLEYFAPKAKIIHIDIDPAEIGKNVKPTVPIVGDAKRVLMELLKLLNQVPEREWNSLIQRWKQMFPLKYDLQGPRVKPQYVVDCLNKLCPDAIITTEVGQNQMWAAQFFRSTKPRNFICSGGLGSMGYGLPAAIGAKIGRPQDIVIDIAGDGSFFMSCQQLAVAVDYHIPIKVLVLNNQYLGMVRQWQQLFYDGRYSQVNLESKADICKIAEGFGAVGLECSSNSQVESILREAITMDDVVVVDFKINREENVFPMVPPGGKLSEMIDLVG